MVKLTSEPRPKWMSDDLLKTCVRNHQKLPTNIDVCLDDTFITYVVAKGENYMSVLYRVKVQYRFGPSSNEVEEVTVIMKAENDHFDGITSFAFEREAEMYRDVIPQWHDMLEKKELKAKFSCRYIHSAKVERTSILIMEDLKQLEYGVADRTKGLNLEHCKLLLGKMARMHAASMVFCHDQNDGISNAYKRSPFFNFDEDEKTSVHMKETSKMKIVDILEGLEKYPTKYERVISLYKKIDNSLEDSNILAEMIPYEDGNKFNAIIHRDCWTNNIMFKYGSDSLPEDVLFVDFQGSHYTSIAYDFMYFMFISPSLETRKSHFTELKNFYFNSLVKDLKALEYRGELPTLEDYDRELQRSIRVAIFGILLVLPLCLVKLDSESLSREDSNTLRYDEITQVMNKAADDGLWMRLVLASSDIMIEEKLIDAFLS